MLMLICAAAVLETEVQASDLDVNFLYQQNSDLYGTPIEVEPASLWGQFQTAFDRRATSINNDRFQPYNFSNVNGLWTGQDFNDIRNYDTIVARHAFADSFRTSARDTLLTLDLPVLSWIRQQHGFFARLLWNSLDNSDEESVSPLDPSYRSMEYSWWKTQLEEGHLRYGVRPFRTDPYAYVGGRIKDMAHVLFLWDARYYFKNFGDHCFELTLSAPITTSISIELGTSYQFGQHASEKKAVLKLLKTFKSGGIFNAGIEMRDRPALVAGITLPWG